MKQQSFNSVKSCYKVFLPNAEKIKQILAMTSNKKVAFASY